MTVIDVLSFLCQFMSAAHRTTPWCPWDVESWPQCSTIRTTLGTWTWVVMIRRHPWRKHGAFAYRILSQLCNMTASSSATKASRSRRHATAVYESVIYTYFPSMCEDWISQNKRTYPHQDSVATPTERTRMVWYWCLVPVQSWLQVHLPAPLSQKAELALSILL